MKIYYSPTLSIYENKEHFFKIYYFDDFSNKVKKITLKSLLIAIATIEYIYIKALDYLSYSYSDKEALLKNPRTDLLCKIISEVYNNSFTRREMLSISKIALVWKYFKNAIFIIPFKKIITTTIASLVLLHISFPNFSLISTAKRYLLKKGVKNQKKCDSISDFKVDKKKQKQILKCISNVRDKEKLSSERPSSENFFIARKVLKCIPFYNDSMEKDTLDTAIKNKFANRHILNLLHPDKHTNIEAKKLANDIFSIYKNARKVMLEHYKKGTIPSFILVQEIFFIIKQYITATFNILLH